MSNDKIKESVMVDDGEKNLLTNPSPQASQRSILKKRDIKNDLSTQELSRLSSKPSMSAINLNKKLDTFNREIPVNSGMVKLNKRQ